MESNILSMKANLDQIRQQIEAATKLAAAFENPAPTPAMVKRRATEEVESIKAEALAKTIVGVCGADAESYRPGRATETLKKLSAAELQSILNPGALTAFLAAEGEAEASQFPAELRLDPETAAKRLADAEREIVHLSVAEELEIRRIEKAGATALRRASALPAVLLAPDHELTALLAGKAA